jgi:hypothetical protein
MKKKKIGRNDSCPCGSGKKFKKCCLVKPSVTSSPNNIFSLKGSIEQKNNNIISYPAKNTISPTVQKTHLKDGNIITFRFVSERIYRKCGE